MILWWGLSYRKNTTWSGICVVFCLRLLPAEWGKPLVSTDSKVKVLWQCTKMKSGELFWRFRKQKDERSLMQLKMFHTHDLELIDHELKSLSSGKKSCELCELLFRYLTIVKHSNYSKNKIVSDKHNVSDFSKTLQSRKHSRRMCTTSLWQANLLLQLPLDVSARGETCEQVSSDGHQMSLAEDCGSSSLVSGGEWGRWGDSGLMLGAGGWGVWWTSLIRSYVQWELAQYSEVQCMMGNGHIGSPSCWQTDTWKHYFSATSLAGGKYVVWPLENTRSTQKCYEWSGPTCNFLLVRQWKPRDISIWWFHNKRCIRVLAITFKEYAEQQWRYLSSDHLITRRLT